MIIKKVTDISIDIVRGIKYVSNLKMSVALSMAVLGVVHAGHFGHVGHICRSCWSKYLSSVCGTVAVLICGWLAGSQSGPTYMHHSAPQCSQTSKKCLENVRPTSHIGYPINP